MNIKNLSAAYGKKQILTHLSFSLKPGTFTALIGKNGSGKTTLLGCINGRIPYTGEILLEERPLATYSPREKAQKIGLLPQFLPDTALTAAQLITLGRNPHTGLTGRLQPADREAIASAVELTATQDLQNRAVRTLSGGERQRVYLAMLLAQDADILLLDEPTAHTDIGFTAEFLLLLRTLAETQNKTVLAVLHDLNGAVTYAHQLLLLDQGRLADPEEIETIFGVRKVPYTEDGKTKYFYH